MTLNVLDILNKIASTDSTNEKLAILKSHADNETLKTVYRLAYHPRLQYGIKKIPIVEEYKPSIELKTALDFLEFTLSVRKITGNKAIEALRQVLTDLPKSDSEVVERIIKRDLNCGASSTIANKVWKNLIPKQPQMLASSMSQKALDEIKYPAMAQLKADGARCFAEIRGDKLEDVILLSRAGNEYHGLNSIKKELIEYTKSYREVHGPVMVDGELVCLEGYSASKPVTLENMFDEVTGTAKIEDHRTAISRSETNGIANKSLKNTISDQESRRMSFQVWDLVPLKAIYENEKSQEYYARFNTLCEIFKPSNRVFVIESTIVNNLDEAKAIYKNYVEQGLEGIILKNTFAVWENKRSKHLVKFKEEITVDLRIVGVQEHSKNPNKLGAVFLESEDKLIRVKCGSGFTDTNEIKVEGVWKYIPYSDRDELNREMLWANQDDLIGTIAEIKCNGFITAENRKDYVSLFLPVMLKLRYDKSTANTLMDVFPDAIKHLEV